MKGGTVSRCVERVTAPPAREAQIFPRPGETCWMVTFQPREMSQRETWSTAGPSPPLGEWMERSSAASATTSVMGRKVHGRQAVGEAFGIIARRLNCEYACFG